MDGQLKEKEQMEENIKCPFCGEKDFDKIGLKNHLENFCQEYEETISVEEEKFNKRTIR